MKQRQYPQRVLIQLIRETANRQDLVELNTLYVELEEQGDITITARMVHETKAQEQSFILRDKLKNRKK